MNKLGECELSILNVLKDNTYKSEKEIRRESSKDYPLYNALNNLIKKGHIQRRKKDGIYHYRKIFRTITYFDNSSFRRKSK